MFSEVLTVHEGLGTSGRLKAIARPGHRISALEFATLLLLGTCAAAASVFVTRRLGVPGHNIIRVIFPMALGLALVPRRGAASVMGLSAVSAAAVFTLAGAVSLGPGGLTSLALTGFLADVALLGARPGRMVYLRLAVAGLTANLVAFLIRGGAKFLLGPAATGKPFALWWPEALVTYAVCGCLAGLLSAAVWFRFAQPEKPQSKNGAAA